MQRRIDGKSYAPEWLQWEKWKFICIFQAFKSALSIISVNVTSGGYRSSDGVMETCLFYLCHPTKHVSFNGKHIQSTWTAPDLAPIYGSHSD